MKQLLLCVTLLFLFNILKAQTWCPPGATWHFRDYNPSPPVFKDGTVELKYTNNITINGIACKELHGTFYGSVVYGSAAEFTISSYSVYRTYEANNVAYVFNVAEQRFDTIANFNAHIGDKWRYAIYNTHCDDQLIAPSIVTVYDTGHVVINGLTLKKVVVSPPNITPPVVFIERIGGVTGFLFMKQDCTLDGGTEGNFSCYSDDNFLTYMRPGLTECIFNTVNPPVSIGEHELSTQYIKLYPNPNNGNFNLELIHPSEVRIFNALGAEVYQNNFNAPGTFTIDATGIAPGIYYLKTLNDKGHSYSKFIKE